MKTRLPKEFGAVIYPRVSTKIQVNNTSLDMQEQVCRGYCEKHTLPVIKVFREEGESAKTTDRTELQKLLKFCKENKNIVSHVVVYKFDRIARNASDHLAIRALLAKDGITLVSATEDFEDTSMGRFMELLTAGISQLENETRAGRCASGMQERIKEGIKPGRPPLGYISAKQLKGKEKKTLPDILDPEKGYLVEKLWKDFLTGNYTVATLTKKYENTSLKSAKARKLYPQTVTKLLNNKYYAGILIDSRTSIEYKGLHKAMISVEDFEKAQSILAGNGPRLNMPRKKANPDFPLRGFCKCGDCEKNYTGSKSKGRNGRHAYYQCFQKPCDKYGKSIPKSILENDFRDYLTSITPKQTFIKDFEKSVEKIWKAKYEEVNKESERYEKYLDRVKKEKRELVKMRTQNLISDEDFKESLSDLDNQIATTTISLNESMIEGFDLQTTFSYCKNFVDDPARIWFNLGLEGKLRFQKVIFPQGITYEGNGKFRTTKLSVVFEINRQSLQTKTSVVVPRGVEPLFSG